MTLDTHFFQHHVSKGWTGHVFHCITLLWNTDFCPLLPLEYTIFQNKWKTWHSKQELVTSGLYFHSTKFSSVNSPIALGETWFSAQSLVIKFQIGGKKENKGSELEFRFKSDPKSQKSWFKEYISEKNLILINWNNVFLNSPLTEADEI